MGGLVPDVLYEGRGCRQCQGTGYRGRRGIFELMNMTEGIETMVLEDASSGEVRKLALQQGMRGLREDGWRHVREGTTTVEEVLRVTRDERMEVEKEEGGEQ
jgi:type II secretory ATPase GspE/PulE/Tfp pilus assembly ATPase PilB-like protein